MHAKNIHVPTAGRQTACGLMDTHKHTVKDSR